MIRPSLQQPILFRSDCPRCTTRGSFVVDGTGAHCLSCGYEYEPTYANTSCNGTEYVSGSLRITRQRQFPITARCITCFKRAGVKNGVLVRHDFPRTPQSISRVTTMAAMEMSEVSE